MFSNNINQRRHPAIHLLFKSLPLRCQFRNFTNVALAHMVKFPESLAWFKMVLVRSLCGAGYKWWHHEPKQSVVKCLYWSVFVDRRFTTTEKWVTFFRGASRLLFYSVKEYIIFCIRKQPSLYSILVKYTSWISYENEIWNIMNQIREAFYSELRIHRGIELLEKFSPKQMKCMRLLLPSATKDSTAALRDMIAKECNLRYTGPAVYRYVDIEPMLDRVYEDLLKGGSRWCHVSQVLESGGAKGAIPAFMESSLEDRQAIFNYLWLRKVVVSIRICNLPYRQALKQLKGIIERHDLKYDPKDTRNVEEATNFWFCLSCESFRGFVVNRNKQPNSQTNCTAFGHDKVSFNIHDGNVYCVANPSRKNKGGDVARMSLCSDHPCISINMFARTVRFFNQTLVLCSECVTPLTVSANSDYVKHGAHMHCGTCTSLRVYEDTSFCGFCAHRCTVLKEYTIYDDMSVPQQWTTIRLCPRHRRVLWPSNKLLLKSMLWKWLEN